MEPSFEDTSWFCSRLIAARKANLFSLYGSLVYFFAFVLCLAVLLQVFKVVSKEDQKHVTSFENFLKGSRVGTILTMGQCCSRGRSDGEGTPPRSIKIMSCWRELEHAESASLGQVETIGERPPCTVSIQALSHEGLYR